MPYWDISLNDLSDPEGWLEAGRSAVDKIKASGRSAAGEFEDRARDYIDRTKVTVDLPSVPAGGSSGFGLSGDTGNIVIIAVVVIGAMLFLKGK